MIQPIEESPEASPVVVKARPVVIYHRGKFGTAQPNLVPLTSHRGNATRSPQPRLPRGIPYSYATHSFSTPGGAKIEAYRSIPTVNPNTGTPGEVNNFSSAISTLGTPTKGLGSPQGHIQSILSRGQWQGDVMHHISSNVQPEGHTRHLVHTLNPEQTAQDFAQHLIANPGNGGFDPKFAHVKVTRRGEGTHVVTHTDHMGNDHQVHFFRGTTPTREGEKIILKGIDPLKSEVEKVAGDEYVHIYWHPKTGHLWLDLEDSWEHGTTTKLEEKLKDLSGVRKLSVENESAPQGEGWEKL